MRGGGNSGGQGHKGGDDYAGFSGVNNKERFIVSFVGFSNLELLRDNFAELSPPIAAD